MPNTIRDAKTAALGAMMEIGQVIQEFALEWNAPELQRAQAMVEKQLLDQWEAHQPELEAMKAQQPEQYAQAVKQINDIRKKQQVIGG